MSRIRSPHSIPGDRQVKTERVVVYEKYKESAQIYLLSCLKGSRVRGMGTLPLQLVSEVASFSAQLTHCLISEPSK